MIPHKKASFLSCRSIYAASFVLGLAGLAVLTLLAPPAWSDLPAAAASQPADRLGEADNALARLKAGNERFVNNQPLTRDFSKELRARLAQGQQPFAVVLTCADSRTPPELIFDQSKGDIFVVRVAGNVSDPVVLGSIEYAVAVLKAPLIVVMGHEDCGAVKAALAGKELGPNMQAFVDRIRPGLANIKPDAPDALAQAIAQNVRHVIATMPQESAILRTALEKKQVKIVGAVYSIASGKVGWQE